MCEAETRALLLDNKSTLILGIYSGKLVYMYVFVVSVYSQNIDLIKLDYCILRQFLPESKKATLLLSF